MYSKTPPLVYDRPLAILLRTSGCGDSTRGRNEKASEKLLRKAVAWLWMSSCNTDSWGDGGLDSSSYYNC